MQKQNKNNSYLSHEPKHHSSPFHSAKSLQMSHCRLILSLSSVILCVCGLVSSHCDINLVWSIVLRESLTQFVLQVSLPKGLYFKNAQITLFHPIGVSIEASYSKKKFIPFWKLFKPIIKNGFDAWLSSELRSMETDLPFERTQSEMKFTLWHFLL